MKQGLGLVFRTDCLNFDVSPWIGIKKQISIGEGIWNVFLWDFCYCSRLHKISWFNNKCRLLLKLVKDVINGVCYPVVYLCKKAPMAKFKCTSFSII